MKHIYEKKRRALSCALCLLLAAALALSCAACGGADGKTGADGQEGAARTGHTVKSPSGVKVLTRNRLTTETVQVNRDGSVRAEDFPSGFEYDQMEAEEQAKWDKAELNFSGSYMQISGLKDKAVEKTVNEKLRRLCLDNLDRVPPYRGVRAELGEDPQPMTGEGSYVEEYIYFSNNNILSALLFVSRSYRSARDGSAVYLSYTEPLNIDLNTGNEIAIADLFCDDVDALAYLNEKVADAIADSNGDEEESEYFSFDALKIDRPFTGLAADQKYSLHDGGVMLYFDYDTPEFVTAGLHSASLLLPFSDEMAITERFYTEDENIYVSDETPSLHFPSNSDTEELLFAELGDVPGFPNVTVSRRASCAKNTPDFLREAMLDFVKDKTERDIREDIARCVPEGVPAFDVGGNYNFYALTESAGPYLTVSYRSDQYLSNQNTENGYEEYDSDNDVRQEIYDLRSGSRKPVTLALADLFKEGVDYEEAVKAAFAASINEQIEGRNEYRSEGEPKQAPFLLEAGGAGDASGVDGASGSGGAGAASGTGDADGAENASGAGGVAHGADGSGGAGDASGVDSADGAVHGADGSGGAGDAVAVTAEQAARNRRFLDGLYDRIDAFYVKSDGLTFDFDDLESFFTEVYGEEIYEDENFVYLSGTQYISYELLDCSQMTIFEY